MVARTPRLSHVAQVVSKWYMVTTCVQRQISVCGEHEFISSAVRCCTVRTPCVVCSKHVRCSSCSPCKCGECELFSAAASCWVLVNAHTVRCKCGVRTVRPCSVPFLDSSTKEVPSQHEPRTDDAQTRHRRGTDDARTTHLFHAQQADQVAMGFFLKDSRRQCVTRTGVNPQPAGSSNAENVHHALNMLRRVCVISNPYGGGTHHVRILLLQTSVFARGQHALACTACCDLGFVMNNNITAKKCSTWEEIVVCLR